MAKSEIIFNEFSTVEDVLQRAWNQFQFGKNLHDDHDPDLAQEYFDQLTSKDRLRVVYLGTRIALKGELEVEREVIDYVSSK